MSAEPGPPPFNARGWILLGEHVIDHRFTTDHWDFSQKRGKVTKLMIAVLDGELYVHRFRQQLLSGKSHETGTKHHFRDRARTRSLPIPDGEILRALHLEWEPLPVGARTRIQVWAQ